MDLGPFGNKIDQGLGLDRRTWRKLNCEGGEFHRPFDDPALGVSIVEDVAEWVGGCHLDLVSLEVVPKLS